MEETNKATRLLNAGMYLRNAILEIRAIPCECRDEDYCDRCCLVDDVVAQKKRH